MKKKIIVTLICMLLIATVFLPTVGSMKVLNKTVHENNELDTIQLKQAFSGKGPNLDKWAITSTIDLSDVTSADLEIITLYEILYVGEDDYGYIKISDNGGGDWTTLKAIQGYTQNWKTIKIDLINWTDKNILIAFEFKTVSDSISDGWWIQKIEVKSTHETHYYEDFSEYDIGKPWGDWTVTYLNEPPNAPPFIPAIYGEKEEGKVGENLNFTFTSDDPDFDDLSLYIKWGDSSPDIGWIGPYSSGQSVKLEHNFTSKGTYTIQAKARDDHGEESKWGSLEISITRSRNKQSTNTPFLHFLQILLDRIFSSFFNLLQNN